MRGQSSVINYIIIAVISLAAIAIMFAIVKNALT